MSLIQSTKGRNQTNNSFFLSSKSNKNISKSETIKKFTRDMPLIDNLSTKEITDSLNLEQTLINFYEYCLDSYKKKLYDNLYRELELNESLIYIGTKESFKIVIIKIKCLMKLMIEKYENEMNDINDEEITVKEYINRIQKEFLKLNNIIKRDDYDEYETITQIYCKFLIYLIKFSQKK